MLTTGIKFLNFKDKNSAKILKKKLNFLLKENNQVLRSLSKDYKNDYNTNIVKKYKKFSQVVLLERKVCVAELSWKVGSWWGLTKVATFLLQSM